jgi:EAL domain-containing protein (putative c-di-GMP-specific phosphodiesterase class I)
LLVALSEADVSDTGLADRLSTTASTMPSDDLVLLIDDRILRRGSPAELDVIARLRIRRFGVVGDGVGRGGADSGHLRRMPLTALRIAPGLLAEAARGEAELLEAVLAGAGVPVIATGCDAPEHLDLLLSYGCRYAQGRLLGTPMPLSRVVSWAAGWTLPEVSADAMP